jgi:glycosyltransferase involved in cell wall biosynthesis
MDMSLADMNPVSLPSVSVIVTSFNHKPIVQRLLPQLQAEDYPREKCEIIVVDGGSTDGSREWLGSLKDARLHVILQEQDRGRSAMRNEGIRVAHGEIIIMLDGDHTIDKNFILPHVESHARQECVVVGHSQFTDRWRSRALDRYLNTRGARKLLPGSPLPGRYFITRNCSVPRSVLERVGLFDETFSGWGGEDLELGMRFEEIGVKIIYEPRTRAWHHHDRPLNALLRNLELYGEKSIPHLVERHPQLYRELNLHQLRKFWLRILMLGAVYHPMRMLAGLLMPFYVPTVVFDYLHLRQYGRGFLRAKKGKT